MVNNVSFNGTYTRDYENVAKYALGTSIVAQEESPFAGMGLMIGISGAMSAFQGIKWLNNSYKNAIPEGFTNGFTKEEIALTKKMANPLKDGGWKTAQGYRTASNNISNAWNKFSAEATVKADSFKAAGGLKSKEAYKLVLNEHNAKVIKDYVPTGDKFEKLSDGTKNAYNSAKEAADYATKNPTRAKNALKVAERRLANANAMAHAEYVASTPTSTWSKIGKGFKKYTGISFINGKLKNLATTSPLTAKLLKHGKGNGIFLAITGGIELFTQVIPAFGLGADKGVKQLAKSTVKTGASIGGWVVGSAVGAKGGAMLGAAIGSIFPGVGTVIGGVIGGVVGFLGGCLGAWAATKVADKVVGKNELDIAKEEQAKKMANEAAKSPEATQQLIAAAGQRLEAEGADSEDAKIAFGSLKNIAQLNAAKAQTANTDSNQASPNLTGKNIFANRDYMNEDMMSLDAGLLAS